jgi:hypothetical protein
MQVSEENVLDLERVLGSKRKVLADVPLRIDNHCSAGLLVSDNVGSVRQAMQIKLFKDHDPPLLFADGYFGCGTMRI